jgi:hypothetical protein
MTDEKIKMVGCSYIGSKQIFRIILGEKDYRPCCFHMHESSEEALACKQALEYHAMNIPAPFPIEENRRKK